MKINRDRLVQIIKEELDDYDLRMAQDDPEEFLSKGRAGEGIKKIDAKIALLQSQITGLQAEKENLMVNIAAGKTTQMQSIERGTNE